jgi:hypothetical protein
MAREDIIIRMSYSTYKRIRDNFYQRKNESLEDYFKRLADEIDKNRRKKLGK